MSYRDICQNGPFQVELKVHITDGERNGVANYELPKGTFPTSDDIRKALTEVETQIKSMGDFRLMNRAEFIRDVLDLPGDVVVPGSTEFQSP
jgi:hypothetical protein